MGGERRVEDRQVSPNAPERLAEDEWRLPARKREEESRRLLDVEGGGRSSGERNMPVRVERSPPNRILHLRRYAFGRPTARLAHDERLAGGVREAGEINAETRERTVPEHSIGAPCMDDLRALQVAGAEHFLKRERRKARPDRRRVRQRPLHPGRGDIVELDAANMIVVDIHGLEYELVARLLRHCLDLDRLPGLCAPVTQERRQQRGWSRRSTATRLPSRIERLSSPCAHP